MALSWIGEALGELERRSLLREPRVVSGAVGPEVVVDGRRTLLFCSNDYLGLAGHPDSRAAMIEAVESDGVGAAASRLVSGTHDRHRRLEARLAEYVGAESALSFPTGFMANLAVLTTFAGPGDVIFSDELNHASIVQGCRLSRAHVEVYPHRDVGALREMMSRVSARRRLVVTDGLFSVDGDAAPVAELAEVARRWDAALVVDEAHSLGVVGPQGRGLCAREGIRPDVLIGTFGKAFGCAGAFVAATREAIRLLESRATSFIYTTAQPLPLVAAIDAALTLVLEADDRRARLLRNADRLRRGLSAAGAVLPAGSEHHIVPTIVPGAARAMAVSAGLLERGVFVQALRPPTVPAGTERLRWAPSSEHSFEQIDRAVAAFAAVMEEEAA